VARHSVDFSCFLADVSLSLGVASHTSGCMPSGLIQH
jgi:hypothetical protein